MSHEINFILNFEPIMSLSPYNSLVNSIPTAIYFENATCLANFTNFMTIKLTKKYLIVSNESYVRIYI